MGDAELLRDLREVARLTLILLGRGARDNLKVGNFCQPRHDLILNTCREVRIRLVIAQVFERQDRNRFLERFGVPRAGPMRCRVAPEKEQTHRDRARYDDDINPSPATA